MSEPSNLTAEAEAEARSKRQESWISLVKAQCQPIITSRHVHGPQPARTIDSSRNNSSKIYRSRWSSFTTNLACDIAKEGQDQVETGWDEAEEGKIPDATKEPDNEAGSKRTLSPKQSVEPEANKGCEYFIQGDRKMGNSCPDKLEQPSSVGKIYAKSGHTRNFSLFERSMVGPSN